MRALLLLALLATALAPAAHAQMPEQTMPPAPNEPLPETNYYSIETSFGRMVVHLFDDTPIHRDNFKRLVQEAYYDSTTFHRVIEGFMIQGGDPNSRDSIASNDGQGDPGYSVPAEIRHHHFRGALAAARQPDQINPERASSGSQFYLVQGRGPMDQRFFDQMEGMRRQMTGDPNPTPPDVAARYLASGGALFLDGQYTVFGEIVEGITVLDQIAATDTPRRHGDGSPWGDRPTAPIWMTVYPLLDYTPPSE